MLRHWTFGALFNPSCSPATRDLAACSGEAWKLMLRVERCALPLLSSLPDSRDLPQETLDVLRTEASREMRSALLARQQCQEIGRIAEARGWRVVVLKGACPALKGSSYVGVADMDLLCSATCLGDVRATLIGMGFRESGKASPHHLSRLVRDGALPVELHFAIPGVAPRYDVWSEARPDSRGSGLSFLGATDQVWHLLVESLIHHPHRRGRLRDLCLLTSAVSECSDRELRDVRTRVTSNPYARPLDALLNMTIEASAGREPTDSFPVTAAASYLWADAVPRLRLPSVIATHAQAAAFSAVGSPTPGRIQWMRGYLRLERPSRIQLLRKVEHAFPRWGRAIRHGVSTLPIWALAPVALLLVRRARGICGNALPLFGVCGAVLVSGGHGVL